MKTSVISRLDKLAQEGETVKGYDYAVTWSNRVSAFLQAAAPDESDRFDSLSADEFWDLHASRIGFLQGVLAEAEADASAEQVAVSSEILEQQSTPPNSRKVFVVHGHDSEAKEKTARFLERLGLQPIVLHEQPSFGRTVIEKFETYSGDIAFAVILLTPDDVGAAATTSTDLRARARQNVIMELGFFIGRLGRVRVCALHKGGVELPSDYQGVLYVEMDEAGAWKAKLAQELVQAKLPIDLTALLGG